MLNCVQHKQFAWHFFFFFCLLGGNCFSSTVISCLPNVPTYACHFLLKLIGEYAVNTQSIVTAIMEIPVIFLGEFIGWIGWFWEGFLDCIKVVSLLKNVKGCCAVARWIGFVATSVAIFLNVVIGCHWAPSHERDFKFVYFIIRVCNIHN